MIGHVLEPDLVSLREKAEQIETLVTPPAATEERVGEGDLAASRAERRSGWLRTVEDRVLDLSNSMPQGVEDYDVRKLLELVVELRRLLDADPDVEDADGSIELATMRAADVVQRLRRRLLQEHLDDPRNAAGFVLDCLARIPVSEVARLLGVSTTTVRSWQHKHRVRQNAERVVLIAHLLSYLRISMTPMGVMMWFDAERDQLQGRTPMQLIEASPAEAYEPLIGLARGARGQLAG